MVALIDANVILNYITEREDKYLNPSKKIVELCADEAMVGFMAFHTVSIIWYSLRLPAKEKREWLFNICSVIHVVGATHDQVMEAIRNEAFKDFEDCLQDACAQQIGADCLVTCNTKDFAQAKTKVYAPDELIEALEAENK